MREASEAFLQRFFTADEIDAFDIWDRLGLGDIEADEQAGDIRNLDRAWLDSVMQPSTPRPLTPSEQLVFDAAMAKMRARLAKEGL